MSDDLVKRARGWNFCWPSHDVEMLVPAMADRIEELEAKNKRLNEQMDSIEEMGTESLNALPDCLMRLAPALVENDELKPKLEKAVEVIHFVYNSLHEINPSNYDHDDVCLLNDKSVEAIIALSSFLAELSSPVKGETDE